MKLYKVLWIDDDFNKEFDRLAYQNGLELTHFKTSREGMNSLESDLQTYDAVILDGVAYNETEDEEHSIDGLINSLTKITVLKLVKWLPVFVFTGVQSPTAVIMSGSMSGVVLDSSCMEKFDRLKLKHEFR